MGEQVTKHTCPYQDMVDNTKECGFTTDNIEVHKMHERAKHNGPKEITDVIKETTEAKVKEEVAKKTAKRFESKPIRFAKGETREEFKRKKSKFKAYQERTEIKEGDIADDLYRSCETPIKRKLVTSSKITSPIKETNPEVMWKEIERLCLLKVNKIIERVEFRQLEQGEEEKIN